MRSIIFKSDIFLSLEGMLTVKDMTNNLLRIKTSDEYKKLKKGKISSACGVIFKMTSTFEPCHKKTCLRGLRPGLTQI